MALIFKKATAQPAFTVAAAITGTTEATQTLTCAYTVVRARAANVAVRWYRHTADDGSDPTGVLLGTGSTYVLTGTDVGNYIRAIVTAINPAGAVQSTTSYTAIITSGDPPEPPVLVTPAAITGTADVGETLTVTYSFTGQDSVAIQWYSYSAEPTGNPLVGTDEVLLGTASTQALTETEAGRWIGVVVTATNAVDDTQTSASVAMAGVDPYAPIAPAQYSVPAYDDSALEAVYCNSGDDLQAKLNQLRPGQKLILEAGATWTGYYVIPNTYLGSRTVDGITRVGSTATVTTSTPHNLVAGDVVVVEGASESDYNGEFVVASAPTTTTFTYTVSNEPATPASPATIRVFPAKWTYIISSQIASLPEEGQRVSASNANNMPCIRLRTWTTAGGNTVPMGSQGIYPALDIHAGVSKLRICGIEIGTAWTGTSDYDRWLVMIGRQGWEGAYGEECVFDRCYVHGNPTSKHRDGCVLYYGIKKVAIIGSTIDYFQGPSIESHGLQLYSAIGPTLIHNNTIIAAGINIFICDNRSGGQTLAVTPADITITKNYIAKRLEWDKSDPSYAGIDNMVKGLIESKGSKRVLVRGNVLHHAWFEDQPGQPWFNQNEGGDGVWDVDYRDNLIVDAGQLNMANPFDAGRGFGFQRIRFRNNLFANPRASLPQISIGGLSSPLGFGRYVTIDHNTWVFIGTRLPGSFLFFSLQPTSPTNLEHVKVTNNIWRQSNSGIGVGASSLSTGYTTATTHMADFYFDTNVAVGSSQGQYNTEYDDWKNFASGSTGAIKSIWSNANVGYVNTAFTELGHFALDGSSQFKNAATDGTDIGADIAAIAAQINASDNPLGA